MAVEDKRGVDEGVIKTQFKVKIQPEAPVVVSKIAVKL